jgi:hypothetical protein
MQRDIQIKRLSVVMYVQYLTIVVTLIEDDRIRFIHLSI